MLKKILFVLIFFNGLLFNPLKSFAAIESTQQFQNGPFYVSGAPVAPFTVTDSKFTSPDWSNITNTDVRDIISLRVIDNAYIGYAFTYSVNLHVDYYTDPAGGPQSKDFTLTVNYDPNHGITYKGLDTYEFTGAFKMVTTITGASQTPSGGSTDYSTFLQLCSRVVVNRRYTNFDATATVGPTVSPAAASKQVSLTWSNVTGAEEYDVEWTTINDGNPEYTLIDQQYHNGGSTDLSNLLDFTIFRHNSSRITTPGNMCTLSTMFTDNYLLIRIRAVRYLSGGLRDVGNWDYKQNDGVTYNIIPITWNDPNMNWQYSAAFAEEGKKKEVINYFDGSLRGRQTVTINNSDNVALAQENIYDEFGRATASILPAPVEDTGTPYLRYIANFNIDQVQGKPYDFSSIFTTIGSNCEPLPNALSATTGVSKYYSGSNGLLTTGNTNYKSYDSYIPDAGGFPLSITQYTPDNTGRIKLQGGVGPQFQPGTALSGQNSNTTKYYYGKPEQWELDQLFGNDVGYAEHYLKNMVVDPNGQISVSYLNASGKTIATALAGDPPASLSALDSYAASTVNNSPGNGTSTTQQHIHLLKPEQFVYDGSALKLSAHTTYLADAIDPNAQLTFDIQKLTDCYPNTTAFSPCTSCFYKMVVNVNNECDESILPGAVPYTADVQLGSASPIILTVPINQPGEYYVDIEFTLDPNAITTKTDNFITQGIASGYIQSQFNYIKANYLDGLDVSGCYSDCHTCETLLSAANMSGFEQMVKNKCLAMNLDPTAVNSTAFTTWIDSKYADLKSKCDALQSGCQYSPCDAVKNTMLADVSPGGQYALFDTTYQAIEKPTNVLYINFNNVFGPTIPTAQQTVTDVITRDNGTQVGVYDPSFTLADMVEHWNPAWANLFLPYHPEYCQLQTCMLLSDYKNWDEVLQTVNNAVDVAGIPSGGTAWSPSNAETWLLNEDQFFTSAIGSGYKAAMLSDLQNYSTNVLGLTPGLANKSLMQYNDFVLYCNDGTTNADPNAATNKWLYCTPETACRVPDREWTSYRDLYLALKTKYYTIYQNTRCGANCPVGQPLAFTTTANPLATNNYAIAPYINPPAPLCTSGTKSIRVSYTGGTLNQAVTVQIYYPLDNTSTSSYVHLSPGNQSAQVCVPDTVPVSSILIKSVLAGTVSPGDNYISYTDARVGAPTTPVNDDCNGYSETDIWHNTIVTLYNAGVPVNAGPNGVVVYMNYNTQSYNNSGGVLTEQILIPPGASSASYMYRAFIAEPINSYPCDPNPLITQVLSCVQSVANAGLDPGITPCPGYTQITTGCPELLASKISRFPTVQNGDFPTGPVTTDQGAALQAQTQADIQSQATDMCTGNAEMWMNVLNPGLVQGGYSQTVIDALRAALIQTCAAGADVNHPTGASDLAGDATPGSATYASFGAAIKGVLGLSAFTPLLNPWLITSPAPYNTSQQMVQQSISNTNTGICSLLTALWGQIPAGSSNVDLFNYLTSNFGAAMTLSQDDLNTLVQSCNNCRFIMAHDVTLPVFLDPSATVVSGMPVPGVIDRSTYNTANVNFSSLISGGSESVSDYGNILSNYMNQQFGFSLTYDDYLAFQNGSAPYLVNQTPFKPVTVDPNACAASAFETAISSGLNAYNDYIAYQRQQFRASYISTCSAAQAYADLDVAQKTYHYTLYYYDQADNLVRTVPPAGVHLLTGAALDQVTVSRLVDIAASAGTSCNYDGTRVRISDEAGALTALSTALNAVGPAAIEMWLYNSTTGISQFTETTTDKTWLFNMAILNNTVGVDIYPITNQSSPQSTTFNPGSMHYRAIIPASMLPLTPWTHVVIQGQNGIAQGSIPQIWIDGVQLTVTAGNSPLAAFTVSATGTLYPDIMPTLQDIRFYQRVLDVSPGGEINQDATNACLMPQVNTDADNLWYAFNVPSGGVPATIASTGGNAGGVQPVYPSHTMPTSYAYNSTNQVSQQNSPDGGTNKFWYDLTSRLSNSQNDKQAPNNQFSYTRYDALGRIIEVGQETNTPSLLGNPDYIAQSTADNFYTTGTLGQITHTWYDYLTSGTTGLQTTLPQNNLRKRVAASTYSESVAAGVTQATYYNYDIDGNVSTLWQQIAGLGTKQIDYEFDLISGKVNFVKYQDGQPDNFYYQYEYDADNRITDAWSGTQVMYDEPSNTSVLIRGNRKLDAHYQYYLHGPLARVELGDEHGKVQGIDYAYTLQGWLKGVNASTLAGDMGSDGNNTSTIGKDAYAYSLGYYNGDYTPIGGTGATAFGIKYQAATGDITGQNLYNGNISNSTMAISALTGYTLSGTAFTPVAGAPMGYTYHYDQLNRIADVRQHSLNSTWNSGSITPYYTEDFGYDGNGNIASASRYSSHGHMDALQYNYTLDANGYKVNNKLNYVIDNADDGVTTTDIKTQSASNYNYDAIGNLTSDAQAGITSIAWTVYGKIQNIAGTNNITYAYNPAGQRVSKILNSGTTTYYVRDAQGNTLALYDAPTNGGTATWREQDLYGSSRLGQWHPNLSMATGVTTTATDQQWHNWGLKEFELDNHLGNVMATITDRRVQVANGTTLDHLEADVVNAQDYYAFGMQQPGRTVSSSLVYDNSTSRYIWQAGSADYRYGFNGKENDNDVGKGVGNQQDYGMRIYDPRLGRFLSVDPLSKNFPWYTPYQFAGDNPIEFIDLDGEEPKKGTANYGQNVMIGNVNDASLNSTTKMQNNNWLGSPGDLEAGLKYIESLKQDMKPTTQLMNVVFDTHGGFIKSFLHNSDDTYTLISKDVQFRPDPQKGDLVLTPGDITTFLKTGTTVDKNNDIVNAKNKSIGELKQIFDKIGEGGTFVFSACRIGDDDNMGKALQQLSGGRINIYVTPDKVRESDQKIKILELNEPRINDEGGTDIKGNPIKVHFVSGFVLFPAGFKDPKKTEYNDPIRTEQNIRLNSTGAAVQRTDPKEKVAHDDGAE